MFKPVSPKVDFPAMEREILAWWQREGIVQRYLHRNDDSDRRYSFIDGPITANNPMGVHHAWGRAYKDLYQRFKTMQGFKQRYQNGFDGQGLWIEVEVEKELGFHSKKDIEAYGIDRFVERCKERVRKFAGVQTEQSVRLGYWMDWDNSYHTMDDENNYTIWHFLKVCNEKGWLYEGTDVMPWCPRCGTGLSEHEIVTEGYREVVHPGLFVKFPLVDRAKESLLVWTTTPWTLSSNVAAAVHPRLTYVKVRQGDETLYLAKARLETLKGDFEVERELLGSELVGLSYHGPFDELPAQNAVEHRVIPWEEVTEDEGTGVVHIAPGAGKEDFALGKEHGLAVVAPLDDSGDFVDGFDWLSGMNVSEVNEPIFDSLRRKGVFYHVERYPHRYPVCWRCDTELVFRLVTEWFISMDELRDSIADVARKIRWIPEFGLKRELDWLQNMDDWMISKKRYWGLALPIYKCACGHFEVIGSETELEERAVEGWREFQGHSPHRPWLDAVKIACAQCGEKVSRIRDVGNPWLDAGVVPFSTLRYRHDRDYWRQWFPADWISESFPGQFRNWFYSMLVMGTVLENQESFRCVFSYALMRDEKGEAMHKSKGNAIWFDEAAEEIGVDTMRWLFAGHRPASNLNFGYSVASEARRRFIIPLWNVYSFFVTYANIDGFDPKQTPESAGDQPLLDRWVLSRLHTMVGRVEASLEEYDAATASRAIESFVDDLSNWYVRRSRRRFWKSENDQDKASAYGTLYQCLCTLIRVLAPFLPFLTEEMYQNLVRSVDGEAPASVHLTSYPEPDQAAIDEELERTTDLVIRTVSLGRSARNKARLKIRQPLEKLVVAVPDLADREAIGRQVDHILEELNVKAIAFVDAEEDLVEYRVQGNPAVLGPKYGRDVGKVMAAVSNAAPRPLARKVKAGASAEIGGYTLEPGELDVRTEDRPGFAASGDDSLTVAVTTEVTPELALEGRARELVHRIQTMRRAAGFDIADRIATYYEGSDDLARAFEAHGDYIGQETLSVRLVAGPAPEGAYQETQKLDGAEVSLAVQRVDRS